MFFRFNINTCISLHADYSYMFSILRLGHLGKYGEVGAIRKNILFVFNNQGYTTRSFKILYFATFRVVPLPIFRLFTICSHYKSQK